MRAPSNDDKLNRYTAIKDGNTTVVTYVDNGVSAPVKVTYNQPGLVLDYTASTAWDRFDRIIDQAWKKSATDIVRIKHGYDRVGNRLYREDGVGSAFSEVYTYDGVNQLIDMQRGVLNPAKTGVTSKNWEENFAFDATGNWLNFKQDTTGNGTFDLNQTRTHNKVNGIATIAGSNSYVASDRNGNMTKLPKPNVWNAAFTCVYDAWNRLTQVKNGNTIVATYSYNGLNHRVKKVVGNETRTFWFNDEWQCLEERIGNTVDTTYVWGLRYMDDLIYRDKNSESLYSLHDPNWNVVALCDTNGVVKERMTYSAFGQANWRDASFGAKAASAYSWNRTFTGQVLDNETGLLLYRNRFYHNGLGRFVTRDPIGYKTQDVNLHRYVQNLPIISTDAFGLQHRPLPSGPSIPRTSDELHQGEFQITPVYDGPSMSADPNFPCCGNTTYNPEYSCCENDSVVSKVSVWHCTRPVNAPYIGKFGYYTFGFLGWHSNNWIPNQPRHSYICCNGANSNCYGMQQMQKDDSGNFIYDENGDKKYTKKGDPIPKEGTTTGTCYEYKVCPSAKKQACDNPKAPYDYNFYSHNCNVWAAGIVKHGTYCPN